MSRAAKLQEMLRAVAVFAWLCGLTLAEFAKLYAFGLALVLIGIAAAGGAGALGVIVAEEKKKAAP